MYHGRPTQGSKLSGCQTDLLGDEGLESLRFQGERVNHRPKLQEGTTLAGQIEVIARLSEKIASKSIESPTSLKG